MMDCLLDSQTLFFNSGVHLLYGKKLPTIIAVADPENKAGGFTTTVRKSLHVTSIRGRVREGDVPPPARSAEAQRCSTICGRYLIEKSARQSTFNLA